jgi:dolichol kinase
VNLTPEEINRKLLHGLAVVLPAGIFYGPDLLDLPSWSPAVIIGSLFALALLIESLRFRHALLGGFFRKWFGSMLRAEEATKLTGATYVCGGSFLCSLIALQGDSAPVAVFLALTLFILGDAAAALVGKAIGRVRIGDKTLEGAIGCFALCSLLAIFVFPLLPRFIDAWGEPSLLHALLLSALVAVLELFPIRLGRLVLNDNLYVPVLVTFAALALRS